MIENWQNKQKRNHKTNKQTILLLIIYQNTLDNQHQVNNFFLSACDSRVPWSRKSHQGPVADAVSTWWGKPVNFTVARKQNKITKTKQRLVWSALIRSPVLSLLLQLSASQKRVEKVCRTRGWEGVLQTTSSGQEMQLQSGVPCSCGSLHKQTLHNIDSINISLWKDKELIESMG